MNSKRIVPDFASNLGTAAAETGGFDFAFSSSACSTDA
jgi:hypothetical protein